MPLLRSFAGLAAGAFLLWAVPAQAARHTVHHGPSHALHHGPAQLRPATFHTRGHHTVARRVATPLSRAHVRHQITRTAYHPGGHPGRHPVRVGS